MNFDDWNLTKKDSLYLMFVFLFSIGLMYIKTRYVMSGGLIYPDKAHYLMNALLYSGLDYYNIVNHYDLFLSPVIAFLTSILFRLGIVNQLAISLVSSFFALFGFLGLYILLRYRFNSLLSLTGVIIYGSLSELLINLSTGLLDVPAISISILILLFGIMAIDKNSKYFIIAFPLFILGFFTRYTVIFMLPTLFLYYVIKRDFLENLEDVLYNKSELFVKVKNYLTSKEFKHILLSLILGAILTVLICKFLIFDFGSSLIFLDRFHNSATNIGYGKAGIDVIYDKLFYVINFSQILFRDYRRLDGTLNFVLYFIIGCGCLFKLVNVFKNRKYYFKSENTYFKHNAYKNLLKISLVILMIFAFFAFKVLSNHLITNICFLVSCAIFYSLIREFKFDDDKMALNILFFAYFVINLIFIAILPTKTLRYSLPLLPPLIYFIIYGLEEILDILTNLSIFKNKSYRKSLISKIIIVFLISLFMISAFSFSSHMKIQECHNDLVDVTDYIIENDDDYHNESFGSNNRDYRIIKWYLKDNVTFDDNYTAFDSSNISYVISNSTVELENYTELYNKGMYHVYYRNQY